MKKLLIANRGEIAVRIARACTDYGVQSVAVYADADLNALHVRMADEAYGLEGDKPADTYLNIAKLLAVAKRSGADAVHPGYGFLSESAAFAQAVIDAGLTWVGPSPAAIAMLGDKVQARKLALKVGAPLVAGTADPVSSAAEVLAFAEQHGLPVAIKAAFGGGGRGIKVAWKWTRSRGLRIGGARGRHGLRPRRVLRRAVPRPPAPRRGAGAGRHARQRGGGRNARLLAAAAQPEAGGRGAGALPERRAARAHPPVGARHLRGEAGYTGAGTVEFMVSSDGAISFLEVNTRLQVEHPVTEETTGIDLVIEQLRIAAEGLRCRSRTRRCRAAMPSSSASTPRTWAAASCPRRGPWCSTRPRARACAWTRAWRRLAGAGHAVRLADGQADRHRRHARAGDARGRAVR
jgi:acetyl-CoA/propionyl-CoA carboxylase biotin carboxyl carrier protein